MSCWTTSPLDSARSRAFLGDPDASAYELLFSFAAPTNFASPTNKDLFRELVRSNEDLGNDYIENDFRPLTVQREMESCHSPFSEYAAFFGG